MMKPIAVFGAILFIAACGVAGQTAAIEGGAAGRGEAIAIEKCSGCHEVAVGQSKLDTLWYPSLAKLANRPDADYPWIAGTLRMSHRYMPDQRLSDSEVADVATYIISLGSRRPRPL